MEGWKVGDAKHGCKDDKRYWDTHKDVEQAHRRKKKALGIPSHVDETHEEDQAHILCVAIDDLESLVLSVPPRERNHLQVIWLEVLSHLEHHLSQCCSLAIEPPVLVRKALEFFPKPKRCPSDHWVENIVRCFEHYSHELRPRVFNWKVFVQQLSCFRHRHDFCCEVLHHEV